LDIAEPDVFVRVTQDGLTALQEAASKRHTAVVEILISSGASLAKLEVTDAEALVKKGLRIPSSNEVRAAVPSY
jgi:ankyrin repeat protein